MSLPVAVVGSIVEIGASWHRRGVLELAPVGEERPAARALRQVFEAGVVLGECGDLSELLETVATIRHGSVLLITSAHRERIGACDVPSAARLALPKATGF